MDGLPVIPGVGAVGHHPASGASRRTKVQVSVVVSVLNFVETHVLCPSSTTSTLFVQGRFFVGFFTFEHA